MNNIIFSDNLTPQEFSLLRESVGFAKLTPRQTVACLKNSTFITATYSVDGQIIGVGRVLFDFGYTAYICDVIVHPNFQRRKIGSKIVDSLIKKTLNVPTKEKIMFVLVAAKDKENFYKKLGFNLRPNEKLGAGMSVWLEK